MGKLFYINVTGKNEKELQQRVEDNIKRGFFIYGDTKRQFNTFREVDNYVDGYGYRSYGKITKEHFEKLSVVMARESVYDENRARRKAF